MCLQVPSRTLWIAESRLLINVADQEVEDLEEGGEIHRRDGYVLGDVMIRMPLGLGGGPVLLSLRCQWCCSSHIWRGFL